MRLHNKWYQSFRFFYKYALWLRPDLPHQKSILELLIVEICSREAPLSRIFVEVMSEKLHCLEVLSKEIGILT